MTDYSKTLTPPDYRNLAINPGGEQTFAATWLGSNGVVTTGDTFVSPASGAAHATYTVTSSTSNAYFFGPLGPQSNLVHYGLFAVPASTSLSARVKVRADRDGLYVQPYARLFVLQRDAESNQSSLVETQLVAIGAPVAASASSYTTLVTYSVNNPAVKTATHWQPVVAVFSSNPSGSTANAKAPVVGTRIYADEMFVTETGFNIGAGNYFDGDSPGAYWEGDPHYSSSRTGSAPSTVDVPVSQVNSTNDSLDDENATTQPQTDASSGIADSGGHESPKDQVDLSGAAVRAKLAFRRRRSPSELSMLGDVQLSDLILNTVDDAGVVWICSDIEGWWSIPETDVPDQPKAWYDGSYNTRGRYAARQLTLTGTFIPRSVDDVDGARDRLVRAASLAHVGGWLMTHQDPSGARTDTRGSLVWLSGAPLISTVAANGRTDFSIGLRAPDPIKYGINSGIPPGYELLTLVTSGGVFPERSYPRSYPWAYPDAIFGMTDAHAINRGNISVFPILTMNGPTNGPVVITNFDTGQRLRITRQLYPGEKLVVDCSTRQVTMNGTGNYRFYLDIDVDWLELQPGSNRLRFVEETPSSDRTELQVQWRSGWIG